MSVSKIITLTEQGLNSGPNYNVSYSPDCVVYTASLDVNLSYLGQSVTISVPDNTQCIKLTSTGECTNAVVNSFVPVSTTTTTTTTTTSTSTTTTTTTAPPTTTTTTTAAPTTTTTTLPAADNFYFAAVYACGGCSFAFDTFVRMVGPGIIGKVYRESVGFTIYSYELLNVTAITTGQDLSNIPYNSCAEACSGIPATTTTTTTAAPTYNYYDVTRYTCPSCTSPLSGLVARNNTTGGTLITGNYYNNGDGYVYRIDGYNAGSSYTINLDGVASAGTNCSATCAI
jgi:hypothetical protein